jgi:hypothetical protein
LQRAPRGLHLVEALAAAVARYAPEDQERKRALLIELEGAVIRHPATLLRLHEALCFLQAHPDDPKILELVDRALAAFGARVDRLGAAARRRLHDSGITNTTLDYPFGLPMARWLAARFPRQSDVAWSAFTEEDRLDETLSLLATTAEGDAFSEGGMGGGSGFASRRAGGASPTCSCSSRCSSARAFPRRRATGSSRAWACRFSGGRGGPAARGPRRGSRRSPRSFTRPASTEARAISSRRSDGRCRCGARRGRSPKG